MTHLSSDTVTEIWAYSTSDLSGGYAPVSGLCILPGEAAVLYREIQWARAHLIADHSPCQLYEKRAHIALKSHIEKLISYQASVNKGAEKGAQLQLF